MDNIRKKSANLHENLHVYVEAFKQMPGFMYLLDNNCVLIGCNHNLLQLLQLEKIDNNTVGAIYTILVENGLWNEEQIQLFKQNDINTLMSGVPKTDEIELPVFNDKDEIIYFKSARIPLHNSSNEVLGLLVIMWDVTDQKHMTAQLEAIQRELHTFNGQKNTSPPHTIPPLHQKPSQQQETKTKKTNTATLEDMPKSKKSPQILLIEDNTVAQQAAKSVLMRCNCLVDVVDNESQFDKIFDAGKYDLVFMDIGLENTSGYAFAKQIRKKEHGTKHKVPIIALTGFDPDLVSLDCGYYQMEGAIGKPLKIEQVRQLLQRYLYQIDIEVNGLKQCKPIS